MKLSRHDGDHTSEGESDGPTPATKRENKIGRHSTPVLAPRAHTTTTLPTRSGSAFYLHELTWTTRTRGCTRTHKAAPPTRAAAFDALA